MIKKAIINKFLTTLENVQYGSITVHIPDGSCYKYEGKYDGPHASLIISDERAISALAAKGDIGFAEAYRDGWWDSDDLTNLFWFGLQNEQVLGKYIYGSFWSSLCARIAYLFTQNTLKGSKRNIQAHYDLGNDFYSLWLDESMTYSSAIFDSENQNLKQAQHNKYDRIIEMLNNRSGNILEIGCGWGGFAERAIEKGDYNIKGLTLSEQQYAYAQKRLGNNASFALQDYRNEDQKYDNIVSIEMFEAVGEKFWPVYFGKLGSLLDNKGRAVIQTITIDEKYFDKYKKGGDAIRSFIFPGGMLPSPERFVEEAAKSGLKVTDKFYFGQDYATTLQRWLNKFEAKLPEVRQLGFDDSFIRIWRFYLASCIASFKVNRTNVMQMELCHV